MPLLFYAQPYDISAEGFYFRSPEDYDRILPEVKNQFGAPVEEFELQFIDGPMIDAELAKAWGVNQANFPAFFEAADDWDHEQKIRYILAVGECGYSHERVADVPDDTDLDIYRLSSMRELAEQFVEEGLFGGIPERLQFYVDYDAIARDLAVDYSEAIIAGERLIYRCG